MLNETIAQPLGFLWDEPTRERLCQLANDFAEEGFGNVAAKMGRKEADEAVAEIAKFARHVLIRHAAGYIGEKLTPAGDFLPYRTPEVEE